MSYLYHDATLFWVTRDNSIQKSVNTLDISIHDMIEALNIPSEHRYCYLRQMEAQHLDDFQKAKLALKNKQISSLRYEPGSKLHQIDKARMEILETRNLDLRVIAGHLYNENEENMREREFEFSSAAKMRRERNGLRKVIIGQNTEIMELQKSNDLYKEEKIIYDQRSDLYISKNERYEVLYHLQKIKIDRQTAECTELQRKLDNLSVDWERSQRMGKPPCD